MTRTATLGPSDNPHGNDRGPIPSPLEVVQPDGWPVPDAKQGKIRAWGASREMKEAVCVREGKRYRYRLRDTWLRKEKYVLFAFGCNVKVVIEYDRPVTAEDLTPARLALALNSLFEVEGLPVDEGDVLGLLDRELNRIAVEDGRTKFLSISFDSPLPRHDIDRASRQVRFTGNGAEAVLSERELAAAERNAGPALLLQESLPLAALRSARRLDPRSRVLSISALEARGPLRFAFADVAVAGRYEQHLWIMHVEHDRLYTLVSRGPEGEREAVAASTRRVSDSLRVAGVSPSPATDLAAELPTPADRQPQRPTQPALTSKPSTRCRRSRRPSFRLTWQRTVRRMRSV